MTQKLTTRIIIIIIIIVYTKSYNFKIPFPLLGNGIIRSRNTVKNKRKLQTESKSGNILTKGRKVSKTETQNEGVSAGTFKLEGVSSLPKQEGPSGKGTESSSQEGYSAKRHKLVGCHTSIAGELHYLFYSMSL